MSRSSEISTSSAPAERERRPLSNLPLLLAGLAALCSLGCGSSPARVHDRPISEPVSSAGPAAGDRQSETPGGSGLAGPNAAFAGQLSPSQLAVVLESANKALGSRYRFGGNTRRGFDCSGLTSFVFDSVGIELPRTADQQARVGRWVPLDEARPGDLIFFAEDLSRESPPLTHVGLVVSSGAEPLTMIHASTSRGVIRTRVPSSRYWRERLRFARRLGK